MRHELSGDLFNPPVSFLLRSLDNFLRRVEHGSPVGKLMTHCALHNLAGVSAPRPSMKSAAFSPIMMTGECVCPRVIVGMTDASATRRPSRPRTRKVGSTHGHEIGAILQVPTGW
jgi:hypothetical protein